MVQPVYNYQRRVNNLQIGVWDKTEMKYRTQNMREGQKKVCYFDIITLGVIPYLKIWSNIIKCIIACFSSLPSISCHANFAWCALILKVVKKRNAIVHLWKKNLLSLLGFFTNILLHLFLHYLQDFLFFWIHKSGLHSLGHKYCLVAIECHFFFFLEFVLVGWKFY